MYYTQTDIANMNVKASRALTTPEILDNLVAGNKASKDRIEMVDATKYFTVQNVRSLAQKKQFYVDGVKKTDHTASNEKLLHSFHRSMVLQKVSYGFKNKPTFSSDIEEVQNMLEKYGVTSDEFHLLLQDWCIGASNKGKEFLHPFINQDGNLDAVVTDAENCIPIYENHYQKRLDRFIRYYTVTTVNERGEEKDVYKAEWWDDRQVMYYIQNEKGYFVRDITEKVNPKPHFDWQNTAIPESKKPMGWGRVPFIKLRNNLD